MSGRDMNAIVGSHDLALVTLDTLRFDVAQASLEGGETPGFARLFARWERRHTPGSFTYSAHAAFFAGFLPTPVLPGRHTRPFALAFEGSETIGPDTAVLDGPDIVSGLRARGYHSICVGGVGFFNKQNPLGSVLPGLFDESHWSPELGVTEPTSTENQVRLLCDRIARVPSDRRVFAFLNVSAIHQPNRGYLPGAHEDSPATQRAALAYVDRALEPLWRALSGRAPAFVIVCSDHGTAYGEDGYFGHRIGHPSVWEVPYAEAALP